MAPPLRGKQAECILALSAPPVSKRSEDGFRRGAHNFPCAAFRPVAACFWRGRARTSAKFKMTVDSRAPEPISTRCCVVGGGPAGIMLGFLLARAGVDVVVLEKHADFLRDFRGDTVHPSTLEVLYELGLLEDF